MATQGVFFSVQTLQNLGHNTIKYCIYRLSTTEKKSEARAKRVFRNATGARATGKNLSTNTPQTPNLSPLIIKIGITFFPHPPYPFCFETILQKLFNKMVDTDVSTLQICTYVFKIESDDEDRDDSDEIRNYIQSLLGPDHEVISASKMSFSTLRTGDSSVLQHVLKVKTNAPTEVAEKVMGSDWVREDHILFKGSKPLNISDNNEN